MGVERYIQNYREKKDKETLILNIRDEIEQNYFSLLKHRTYLKAIVDVTDSIMINWQKIKAVKVKKFYYDNQYTLRDDMKTILTYLPSYALKNLYFQSLINSGLVLEIKNKKLRENLENVYKTIESYSNDYNFNNSDEIYKWFDNFSLNNRSLNYENIFDKNKNFELYKLLSERRKQNAGTLYMVENSIEYFKEILIELNNPEIIIN